MTLHKIREVGKQTTFLDIQLPSYSLKFHVFLNHEVKDFRQDHTNTGLYSASSVSIYHVQLLLK